MGPNYKELGRQAFLRNTHKREENPYPANSLARIEWEEGWDEEQFAAADAYKGY